MPALFAICSLLLPLAIADCPRPWKQNGGSCYTVIQDPMAWASAVEVCERFDSHLADIGSQGESDFLKSLAKSLNHTNRNDAVWVGGNDLLLEGEWHWMSDNSIMSFTDWYPGEPNNYNGKENCLELLRGLKADYGWFDADCVQNKNFICEQPMTTGPGFG